MSNANSQDNVAEVNASYAATAAIPNRHSRESGNPELPVNWTISAFTEIYDIQGGTQPPKSEFIYEPEDGYIQLLQIRDFGRKPVPTYVPLSKKLKTCEKTDLLIGRYGASLGRICTGMTGAYNVALAKVIAPEKMYRSYTRRYLESHIFQNELALLSRSAQNGFNKEDLKGFNVPLPPLAEQKIIADKLDELLAQVDTLKARLDAIPAILKRFRQSVLAAAVSGKLTEEWRVQSNNPPEFDVEKLGNLITEMRNGLSPKPNEKRSGYPILRISSVRSFIVDQDDIRHLEVNEDNRKRYSLITDDLLFTRYNGSADFVGVCGRINTLLHETLLYPDKLIRVRTDPKKILPGYLEIFSASHLARTYILSLIKSTSGQKGISGKDLKEMEITLPSTEEQTEIVHRVNHLFTHADQIEQQVKNAQARVNQLTQAILAKAFKGELTEQWRKDNPELISGDNSAGALLARIKAERAAAKPAKKTREKAR
ncbi:restriction endonuclease subunit S [Spongiibacter taiwanensis]|uniref:restriction endonuclease subunit S n=1 Tax=Spongiibacter taiwanensis TaxID=1748242 RepID=UPI0020365C7D|nr:restriction endonuclease subunit S [Spongiibacter taiwanensis]USA44533.1 restriction endonuclease subunit S [Spongiibacter taiwanensis]